MSGSDNGGNGTPFEVEVLVIVEAETAEDARTHVQDLLDDMWPYASVQVVREAER